MPPGGYVQGTAGSVQCSANISIADSTEGSLGNWACFIHLLISEAPFQAHGTQFSGLPRLPLPLPQLPKTGVLAGTDAPPPPQPGPGLQLEVRVLPTTALLPPTQAVHSQEPPPPTSGRRASSTAGPELPRTGQSARPALLPEAAAPGRGGPQPPRQPGTLLGGIVLS